MSCRVLWCPLLAFLEKGTDIKCIITHSDPEMFNQNRSLGFVSQNVVSGASKLKYIEEIYCRISLKIMKWAACMQLWFRRKAYYLFHIQTYCRLWVNNMEIKPDVMRTGGVFQKNPAQSDVVKRALNTVFISNDCKQRQSSRWMETLSTCKTS